MVGIGLFLSHLANSKLKCSELRATYPDYFISKNKIELTPEIDVDDILLKIKNKYRNEQVNDIDGVRIDFDKEWVHLRKSNTEPIIRIYSESKSAERANTLAAEIISAIREIAGI
jgi:phosphomannomutase